MYLPHSGALSPSDIHRDKGNKELLKKVNHSIMEKKLMEDSKMCYLIFPPTISYSLLVKISLVYLLREMVSTSRTVNYFMFIKETCFVIRCCYHLTMTFAYFKDIKICIHMIKTICTYKFTTCSQWKCRLCKCVEKEEKYIFVR